MTNPGGTRRRVIMIALLGLAVLVALGGAGFIWTTTRSASTDFNGTELETDGPPKEFTLDTAAGPVSASDYRGQLLVLYFGYTHCPDICPLTLSKLADAREQLGDDADQVQVMMISVDPERDTPEILADYVSNFDPSFIGATAPEEEILQTAAEFGIYVEKREVDSAAGYLVDHTTHVIVIDQEGKQRLVMNPALTADEVAEDLEKLL